MRNFKLIKQEDDGIDHDFYSEDFRDSLLDDDEMTPEESAFMQGWDDAA